MIGTNKNWKIFVFTGPDGAGRKTIADMAGTTLGLKKILSYTTRQRRPGELEGQDYHYISVDSFLEAERKSEFIESVSIDGAFYGIKHADIERNIKEHRFVYLILNPEGAQILQRRYGGGSVIPLFLYADRDSLIKRQRHRGDNEELIRKRMAYYDKAMSYLPESKYSFENVDLSHTVFAITNEIEPFLNRQLLNLD